jgi:hypothetical protein
MVFSYIRLRCSVEDAMARYGRWVGEPELGPPRLIPEKDHIDLALDEAGAEWLGLAVFIYEADGWAVVEEVSGGLGTRPAEAWLALAAGGDLVYAASNDAVPYAQIIAIEGGRLVRNILKDDSDPTDDVDVGRLPEEASRPFKDWTDVAMWVETDEEKLDRPEKGWLWIHRSDPNAG